MKDIENINCKICDKAFMKVTYQQAYCSSECRDLFHREKQIKNSLESGPLMKPINCSICYTQFIRTHGSAKICSDKCKQISYKNKIKNKSRNVPKR